MAHSLITGKITGNFTKFDLTRIVLALADAKSHSNLNSLREIPCSCRNREIFLAEQGICATNRRAAKSHWSQIGHP